MRIKKPQDPRKHGLKEPSKVLTETGRIYIADLGQDHKTPLRAVIDAWHKALKDHDFRGHRISEGPHFTSSYYGNAPLVLLYTYEWDNPAYEAEKTAYDVTIAQYEKDLAACALYEEEAKKPPNLTEKIERAKQRLANLEAERDGQPLPYPTPIPWKST